MPRRAAINLRTILAAFALASGAAQAQPAAGDFDFFVLSLSWSPTYCATDDDPDEDQCAEPRGFVAHGLWPQFERGYPEFCTSAQPRWLAQDIIDDNSDIFPNGGLAIHQWRKHGMCAGLPQAAYFDLIRAALEAVTVPTALTPGSTDRRASPTTIEELFASANKGLSATGMSVQCRRGLMAEVRICLTKDLAFRRCEEVDADRCTGSEIAVPSAR